MASCPSIRFYFTFCTVFKVFWLHHFQLSITLLCVLVEVYHKNKFKNRDFSYPDSVLVNILDYQAKSGWLDSLSRQGDEWPPKSQL